MGFNYYNSPRYYKKRENLMKARKTTLELPTIQPHYSRIVRIINLGLQPGFVWEGKQIESDYKIEFTVEICDENMKDGRPFWISKEINNKDSDKSTLYAWALACGTTPSNIDGMLDVPISMTPKLKVSGWPTIDAISGIPEQAKAGVAELANEKFIFDFTEDEPDMETWAKLNEKTQEKIMGALDVKDFPFYNLAKSLVI